jgi:colicin import membrane protein
MNVMSTELVVIEKQNVLAVFTEQGQIDPILEKIATEARSIIADVSTAKGRKEITSVAYRVAQSKTYLDGLGKDLVADMKELPKKVDASRKQMRDFLDALKDEVRLPLDQWEAGQARIEAERAAQAAAIEFHRLAVEHEAWFDSVIQQDWDLAILADQIFNHEQENKRKAAEQAQRERDAQLVQQAAAKAKADAEAVAKAEKNAAEQRERDARLAQERAEQEAILTAQALKDAEAKAAQDKLDAERRAIEAKAAADQALKDAEAAAELRAAQVAQAERNRVAAELKILADEAARRNADQEHKRTINRKALADLIAAGLTEEDATKALTAIVKGLVAKVTINY